MSQLDRLERAYCLPSEYCIFYQHLLYDSSGNELPKSEIANRASKRLLQELAVFGKDKLPAFDPASQPFVLNPTRVHTANSHQPEKNPRCISLVVIELAPPQGYASWEALYTAMENDDAVGTAQADYLNARLNVVTSVAGLYRPVSQSYGGSLIEYFQEQEKIIGVLQTPDDLGESIASIAPHWRVAASPDLGPPPVDSGGPGAQPIDYTPTGGTLKFFASMDHSRWWEAGEEKYDAHVVVLDSIPAPETINNARSSVALLDDLLDGSPIQKVTTIPNLDAQVGEVYRTDRFHAIYDDPTQWDVLPSGVTESPATPYRHAYPQGHDYKMSDHGLFVSGIINSIEPKANIYLIQVLNEYGVGNLESVWCGLLRFWNYVELLKSDEKYKTNLSEMRLVFNCSLGFDAPASLDLNRIDKAITRLVAAGAVMAQRAERFKVKFDLEMHSDELYQKFQASATANTNGMAGIDPNEFAALLWPSFAGLKRLFEADFFDIWRKDEPDSTHSPDGANPHIMLAAAGNGRKVGWVHPTAYYPASDPLVIGVGALRVPDVFPTNVARPDAEQIADYSNVADAPPDSGYYIFGGGAGPQPQATANGNSLQPSPNTNGGQGIVGIYLGKLPNGNFATHKLAEWAGTSFATPILAGIIAAIFRRTHGHPLDVIRGRRHVVTKTEDEVPYVPKSDTSLEPTPPTAGTPPLDLNIIQVRQDR